MKQGYLIFLLIFISSCDSFYSGSLINKSDNEIKVTVCGSDLDKVNYGKYSSSFRDSILQCRTIRVIKGDTIILVSSSDIATPIKYKDLGFQKIIIETKNGEIVATGETIMNLFKEEDIKGIFNFVTGKNYKIEVK